jgi:F-type H+-transporting ATPase subunit b
MADPSSSKGHPTVGATVSQTSSRDSIEDEESELKLSSSVRRLANFAKLSPETTFQLCYTINFLLMLALIAWKCWPLLKATFRARSAAIRRAIDEAQQISEDARKRLGEVERRWAQLDFEIAVIRQRAEAQMKNEERILCATTNADIRRIMEYSQFEIDRAAQQARYELRVFAGTLAVSLARQSIRINETSYQQLVEGFIEGLGRYETPSTIATPFAIDPERMAR